MIYQLHYVTSKLLYSDISCCRDKSYKEAVDWYTTAMHTQENDAHGEFDATMSDPNYLILATQAEMYLEGGFDLEKDPSRAGR